MQRINLKLFKQIALEKETNNYRSASWLNKYNTVANYANDINVSAVQGFKYSPEIDKRQWEISVKNSFNTKNFTSNHSSMIQLSNLLILIPFALFKKYANSRVN